MEVESSKLAMAVVSLSITIVTDFDCCHLEQMLFIDSLVTTQCRAFQKGYYFTKTISWLYYCLLLKYWLEQQAKLELLFINHLKE